MKKEVSQSKNKVKSSSHLPWCLLLDSMTVTEDGEDGEEDDEEDEEDEFFLPLLLLPDNGWCHSSSFDCINWEFGEEEEKVWAWNEFWPDIWDELNALS